MQMWDSPTDSTLNLDYSASSRIKCYVSEALQGSKKDVGLAMHDIIPNYAFKQCARH